jgi:hypothetical protein
MGKRAAESADINGNQGPTKRAGQIIKLLCRIESRLFHGNKVTSTSEPPRLKYEEAITISRFA